MIVAAEWAARIAGPGSPSIALGLAAERIEQLERRAFWQSILGPLALAAGIFVMV